MNMGQFLGYGATVFTPWIPREADNVVLTFEAIDNPDGENITISVYEKDTDEYGAGTIKSLSWTTSGNFQTSDAIDLKELIRLKFEVAKAAASPLGTGIIYRMLDPTWYNKA